MNEFFKKDPHIQGLVLLWPVISSSTQYIVPPPYFELLRIARVYSIDIISINQLFNPFIVLILVSGSSKSEIVPCESRIILAIGLDAIDFPPWMPVCLEVTRMILQIKHSLGWNYIHGYLDSEWDFRNPREKNIGVSSFKLSQKQNKQFCLRHVTGGNWPPACLPPSWTESQHQVRFHRSLRWSFYISWQTFPKGVPDWKEWYREQNHYISFLRLPQSWLSYFGWICLVIRQRST